MKKSFIIGFGCVSMMLAGPGMAGCGDNWALGGVDYYSGSAGAVCYTHTDEYVVYDCKCDWNVHSSMTYECPGDDGCGTYVLDCKLAGKVGGGYARFCLQGGASDACMACGCTSGAGSWTTHSSANYTVTRTVSSVSSSGYTCTGSSTTEYGCKAGYYKKSGSGSSMVCTACPNGGTSATGNTAITGCYLPSGTSFSDSTGSGTYTSNCYYSN